MSFAPVDDDKTEVLPTANINIFDGKQSSIKCRAILDTASTRNFMVESLASLLRLSKEPDDTPVSGLNNSHTRASYRVTATIGSRKNNYTKTLKFLVVPTITSQTLDVLIQRADVKIPSNVRLADPAFHRPAAIQVLIGSGTSLASLCVGQIILSSSEQPDLILQKTQFGWVLGGDVLRDQRTTEGGTCLLNSSCGDISRFWELEELPATKHFSSEEITCEEHFLKNIRRDRDGRFIAALPFGEARSKLGQSYMTALKRFKSLERRFGRDEQFEAQYRKVMSEYIALGYVSRVNDRATEGFFIPHQAVMKESSATTKLRIVFDASASSSTGVSLNEALLAGPTIQDDIFSLLLRFRMHKYVLTGDIEKMYLQIQIREQDRPYLRFLWREPQGSIASFQFNRLIFGLKPAAYMATRCLHRLAEEEADRFPAASAVLKRDLYVDDLLTGADTPEEIIQLQKDVTQLLNSGGFNLRQCASNNKESLQAMPSRCVNLQLQNSGEGTLKTLGVHWDSDNDKITYTVAAIPEMKVTKRNIFAEVAKIFDPLGLLNPVIVVAKRLIQELWKLKVTWDESLPTAIHTRWKAFTSDLSTLNEVSFDRRALRQDFETVEIHGFCDASEKAYGACLYLRSVDREQRVSVRLLCAKSRVAPLKNPQTIPRLELCAAMLLSELFTNTETSLSREFRRTVFWTDSMVALHWIHTQPHKLKTFVANRVAKIQALTKTEDWRHVRTHDNPADFLSRGMSPAELKNSTLWARGPDWLSGGETLWPALSALIAGETTELRVSTCLATLVSDVTIVTRYSSYGKLQRVVALCRRFLRGNNNKGIIKIAELKEAEITILSIVQKNAFKDEYMDLKKGRPISSKSRLLMLSPFIDSAGLIRVGGRLRNSELSFEVKHPIVLPKSDYVTRLIIEKEHLENLHAGAQATLASLRRRFWPLDARNHVRKTIRACVRCTRAEPISATYIMGDLPKERTIVTRPFTNTGADYCGPFFVKEKKLRNRGKMKTYVAIFVCLAVKAVHLELVTDLTTEAFLAALKRFISRRGRCATIYSDNGTNFVGANNELKQLHELINSKDHQDSICNDMAARGIEWKFIPPRAPHCGGLWEAAVRSFKRHFRRVVGNELFTFEQLNTLVIEIEGVLNSRPLTPLSSDPNDLLPLTPAHFLIGNTLTSLPEGDFSELPTNRLSAWQHIQKVKRDFWVRWQKEYVQELNIRRKWATGAHSLQPGSLVILQEDNIPPMQWRIGRVIEVHPGRDGIIRTARIKTTGGEVLRNVRRLAPLLTEETRDKATSAGVG